MSDSFASHGPQPTRLLLAMRLPRQEQSGMPFPSSGDLPDPGIKPTSPALKGRFFTAVTARKPQTLLAAVQIMDTQGTLSGKGLVQGQSAGLHPLVEGYSTSSPDPHTRHSFAFFCVSHSPFHHLECCMFIWLSPISFYCIISSIRQEFGQVLLLSSQC